MNGRKGFYVDSGSNHATQMSNSLFFDWCLGWNGLCVEPDPEYHEGIRKYRTCTLVPECISDRDQELKFTFAGAGGHVSSNDSSTNTTVHCSSLESILQRENRKDMIIDFWSLDVEGHEMTVLRSVNFDKIHVDVMSIEDMHIPVRELDQLMYESNFIKMFELPLDSLYVNQRLLSSKGGNIGEYIGNIWLPSRYQQYKEGNLKFRAPLNLRCFDQLK